MSELEKILNDDLLKCEVLKTEENAARRVDLIKWTHDNTYSIAEVRKDTGKLEVTDLKAASGLEAYKHSVPSERSESHRRYYFKALPEKELSDEDMMYGERREVARCKLELYVLMQLLRGNLWWNNSWGTWFWCSKNDKDLIILRDWIEPNKGEV